MPDSRPSLREGPDSPADFPRATVQRAAEVMLRQYESQYNADHLSWLDFADDARAVLAAAFPGRPENPVHASRMRQLGKHVRVKLDKNVVQEGTLLGFGEGGDFEIQQDDGFVYHCWPLLAITEVPDA